MTRAFHATLLPDAWRLLPVDGMLCIEWCAATDLIGRTFARLAFDGWRGGTVVADTLDAAVERRAAA